MAKILIVDDQRTIRTFLFEVLTHGGYSLLEAASGYEALRICKKERPDLVISDLMMPTMDGFEFVRQLRSDPTLADTMVVFHTATYRTDQAQALARACGVATVVQKTSDLEPILQAVREILHKRRASPPAVQLTDFQSQHLALLTDTVTQKVGEIDNLYQQLIEAYDATLEGWVRALDLRDRETEGHTRRVTQMAVRLAMALGLDGGALIHVRRGALLHDIGKIGVPDGILLKPGPLTDQEWEIMRRHPVYAYEMLSPIAYLREAIAIPYCHHEKWDGTGYPRGLRAGQIPLAARLFAVVDVWDALVSSRPYRAGWPEEKVRAHIREQGGTHFDPQAAAAFLNLDEQRGL